MSQNQQNNQQKQPYQRITTTTQINRTMRHKDRSRNYPVISSGLIITNKNYNGKRAITIRNYRKVA